MPPRAPLAALLLALAASRAPAATPYDDLLKDIPDGANVLTLIDVQKAYDSPLAKAEDWRKSYYERLRGGGTMLPPDAVRAVIAADVNVATFRRDAQVSLVRVRQADGVKDLQARAGGTTGEVAGRFVLLSPRDAYVLPLTVDTLATVHPANRQALARWLRQTANGKAAAGPSPYLRKAADDFAATAPVVIALDLADALEPALVRVGLDGALCLTDKSVNKDALARLVASARGLVFTVNMSDALTGTLRVDFGFDPTDYRKTLHALFLEILDGEGAALPGLDRWAATFGEKSMTLTGPLTTADLMRVLSLFQYPLHHGSEEGGTPAVAGKGVSVPQTKRYLAAVDTILRGVKPPKDPDEAAKAALWTEKAAGQVEQLSRVGVDPVALTAGDEVATRLRSIAGSLRGVPIDKKALDAASYTMLTGAYSGGYGGRGGYGGGMGASVSSNVPELRVKWAKVVADDEKRRAELWNEIMRLMSDARQKLGG